MFGISSVELIIILLIGVVVLGPERLPKVIRTATKWMSQFRRITTELQRTINAEAYLLEHNELKKEAEKELFGSKPKQAKKKPKDNIAEAEKAAENTNADIIIESSSVPTPSSTENTGTENVTENSESAPKAGSETGAAHE